MWDIPLIKKNISLDKWMRISKLLCWKSTIYFQIGNEFKSIISVNSDKINYSYMSKATSFLFKLIWLLVPAAKLKYEHRDNEYLTRRMCNIKF